MKKTILVTLLLFVSNYSQSSFLDDAWDVVSSPYASPVGLWTTAAGAGTHMLGSSVGSGLTSEMEPALERRIAQLETSLLKVQDSLANNLKKTTELLGQQLDKTVKNLDKSFNNNLFLFSERIDANIDHLSLETEKFVQTSDVVISKNFFLLQRLVYKIILFIFLLLFLYGIFSNIILDRTSVPTRTLPTGNKKILDLLHNNFFLGSLGILFLIFIFFFINQNDEYKKFKNNILQNYNRAYYAKDFSSCLKYSFQYHIVDDYSTESQLLINKSECLLYYFNNPLLSYNSNSADKFKLLIEKLTSGATSSESIYLTAPKSTDPASSEQFEIRTYEDLDVNLLVALNNYNLGINKLEKIKGVVGIYYAFERWKGLADKSYIDKLSKIEENKVLDNHSFIEHGNYPILFNIALDIINQYSVSPYEPSIAQLTIKQADLVTQIGQFNKLLKKTTAWAKTYSALFPLNFEVEVNKTKFEFNNLLKHDFFCIDKAKKLNSYSVNRLFKNLWLQSNESVANKEQIVYKILLGIDHNLLLKNILKENRDVSISSDAVITDPKILASWRRQMASYLQADACSSTAFCFSQELIARIKIHSEDIDTLSPFLYPCFSFAFDKLYKNTDRAEANITALRFELIAKLFNENKMLSYYDSLMTYINLIDSSSAIVPENSSKFFLANYIDPVSMLLKKDIRNDVIQISPKSMVELAAENSDFIYSEYINALFQAGYNSSQVDEFINQSGKMSKLFGVPESRRALNQIKENAEIVYLYENIKQ
jgi:hypothetical protein